MLQDPLDLENWVLAVRHTVSLWLLRDPLDLEDWVLALRHTVSLWLLRDPHRFLPAVNARVEPKTGVLMDQ